MPTPAFDAHSFEGEVHPLPPGLATTEAELVAAALRSLGDEGITALTDNSERARIAHLRYPTVRDSVLRAHRWRCALRRVELAPLTERPAFGYSYQFQLPADCLRVLEVNLESWSPWTVEGRRILTNGNAVSILYIAQVTDVGVYDALLYEAMVTRLAAELAIPITGSRPIAEAHFSLFERKLAEARSIDGQEGTPRVLESNDLIYVRGTGPSDQWW